MLGRFVQVYCDDILNFSKSREEHLVHVCMVLETLLHHNLYAKASKCQYCRSFVCFLGCVISERGVPVDPRKVAVVAEWATPTSCTNVRHFVGLANYYCKFVRRFSAIAVLLTALCSPRARFVWVDAEQQIFEALKAVLTSAQVLRAWDFARPTRLLTYASELAGHPRATRRFWPIPSCSLRVSQADPAKALVPAPHAGALGGIACPQGTSALLAGPALLAAH